MGGMQKDTDGVKGMVVLVSVRGHLPALARDPGLALGAARWDPDDRCGRGGQDDGGGDHVRSAFT